MFTREFHLQAFQADKLGVTSGSMRRRGGALMRFLYLVLFLSLVKRGAALNGCMSVRRLAACSMTTERRSGAQRKEPIASPPAFLHPANVDPLNPRAASGYCPSAQQHLRRRRKKRRHTRLGGIQTSPLMTIEVDRVSDISMPLPLPLPLLLLLVHRSTPPLPPLRLPTIPSLVPHPSF